MRRMNSGHACARNDKWCFTLTPCLWHGLYIGGGQPAFKPEQAKMNTFKKFNGEWCIVSMTGATGQTVTVTKRNGSVASIGRIVRYP